MDRKLRERNRLHIELLRIICIYLVIFNHTGTNVFFLFSISKDSRLYWFYMFISIACKVAVPVFFMISGALLLRKNESIGKLYSKRILKILLILFVTSFIYQIYGHFVKNWDYSITESIVQVYSSNVSVALWYLYSYIGMLIMLPILRKLACSMKQNDYLYLSICSITITGIIPIVQYFLSRGAWWLNESFSATIFTSANIVYVMMGHYFENILDEKYYNKKIAIIMIALSVLCIIICCLMTQFKYNITGDLSEKKSQTFHNSLIAMPTFTLYYCSKLFMKKINISPMYVKIIQFLGSTTFGIYLAEGILRERLEFIVYKLTPLIHTLPACLVYVFCVIVVGVFGVVILRKIPIIKKFI